MAADSKQTTASEELKYASGNLKRETGWWGAFVIGLAGTILVTGIAPVMVTPARRLVDSDHHFHHPYGLAALPHPG